MTIGGIGGVSSITEKVNLKKQETEIQGFEDALKKATGDQDKEELRDACNQLEQYMLSSIFKQMKASTTMGETLIPKGDYEEMFDDYLIDERCKEMTEAGGIGLSDMLYEQMSKLG